MSCHAKAPTAGSIVLAVLLVVLVLAPPALAAPKGVIGSFGSVGAAGEYGGELNQPRGIAINSTGAGGVEPGTTYVADSANLRISVFSPLGIFKEAWGNDVTGINEIQALTVDAGGGTYTLTFEGQTTAPLLYNASNTTVASALNGLSSIGAGGVGVLGAAEGPAVRTITFQGKFRGIDVPQITTNGSQLAGPTTSGGSPSATVTTTKTGAGGNAVEYETCTVIALCSKGTNTSPAALGTLSTQTNRIAVDQTDGSVYVGDATLLRVTKFSATGTRIFTVGKDVTTGGVTSTEICSAVPTGCKTGTNGSAGGEFGSNMGGIAVVPAGLPNSGNFVVGDTGNRRIQEFNPTGQFVRTFGWDVIAKGNPNNNPGNEVQKVNVSASDGTFILSFGNQQTGGIARGATESGSTTVTELRTAEASGSVFTGSSTMSSTSYRHIFGQWMVGMPITGPGLQAGTNVASVSGTSVSLSKPASSSSSGTYTSSGPLPLAVGQTVVGPGIPPNTQIASVGAPGSGTITLTNPATQTGNAVFTTGIPYDAAAATVQAQLNALSTIGAGGGSVTVTDGPGDPTGATPYTVTFTGGPLSDIDVPSLGVNGRNLGAVTGKTLTCTPAFLGAISTQYQWLRDAAPIAGATSSTYQLQAADAGAAIQCRVTVLNNPNGGGSVAASVPYVTGSPFPASPRPLPPTVLPELTVTFQAGQTNFVGADGGGTMHCNTGTWSNQPTEFKYQWYISGVPLTSSGSTSSDYIVKPEDLEKPGYFQCSVTGVNATGAVTQMSGEFFGDQSRTQPNPSNVGVGASPPTAVSITDQASVSTATVGANFEVCTVTTECRTGATGTAVGQFGPNLPTMQGIAVDSTGAIYATDAIFEPFFVGRVQKIVPLGGPPFLEPVSWGSVGAPSGTASNNSPKSVAVGDSDRVFVTKQYEAGATPTCFTGLPSISEKRIQELSSAGTTLFDTHNTCAGLTGGADPIGVNTATGNIYVSNPHSTFTPLTPGERIYILGQPTPPSLVVNPPEPTASNAVLSGEVNPNPVPQIYPNPPKTRWQIEYKIQGAPTWTKFRTPTDVGAASGNVPFKTTLTPLLSNTTYEARLTATKDFNSSQAISAPQTFKTVAAPPEIRSAQATKVRLESAQLNALIDPRGSDTEYFFEWGRTGNYGNVTPVTGIGGGQGAVSVTAVIKGLEDGPYHFRAVAKSDAGEVLGEDGTFSFHPEGCPNSLVRQQTSAGYLPDCRAYELVSPGEAGNALISSMFGPPGTGEATNPARIAYMSQYAPLPTGANPPNLNDLYVSTRTETGWKTAFVGRPATESFMLGGPPGPNGMAGIPAGYRFKGAQASPSMDKILLWNIGNFEVSPSGSSMAPFLLGSDGSELERWPSSVGSIAKGVEFEAEPHQVFASGDLTHFFFMSSIAFLPGASVSDIYDNDTVAGTVEVANLDPNDVKFSGYPVESSRDGSHLLMSTGTPPACPSSLSGSNAVCPAIPPSQFYMRVDGEKTYDVTGGKNGSYAGMSRDGGKVYFLSNENVMPDEADTSTDLFMWSEGTDEVSKVSDGGTTGNTDSCSPVESWTTKCGVKLIANYERQCPKVGSSFRDCGRRVPRPAFFNGKFADQNAHLGGTPETDNFIAPESGDIYFYSPEKLDGNRGAEGMQNLYVFRQGAPQFVASFDPPPVCWKAQEGSGCAGGPIGRLQVSANGDFAAFTATSRLTGANNAGIEQMYRFDANTEALVCVSCDPDGDLPKVPVLGSMNGRFLTNDGRVFFSTTDPLQADDTNNAIDIYEYVAGRPQLITAGTGATTAAGCESCGTGQTIRPGLIGVSVDGRDVYFGTYDVLTPDDHNGGNLKIYDARTNGGFASLATPQPCQAADECHGPATSSPPKAPQGTGANLGTRGNAAKQKQTKKKHKKKKKRRKGKAKKHRGKKNASRSHG